MIKVVSPSFFFFQAEDGIRDHCVTGVQTCALPISRGEQGGLGHDAPDGTSAGDRRLQGIRDLRRPSRRGLGRLRRRPPRASRGVRSGLWTGRQPRHRRGADAERDRVRPHSGAVGRDHDRPGSRAAGQLQRLSDAAARGDAAGRGAHRVEHRLAGRRRRAGHAPDRAGGVQRDLRAHGETGPEAADREARLTTSPVTRREFVGTSAGLVLSFYLPARPGRASAPGDGAFSPNAWLRVGTDGIVTLTVDKSEMGQGPHTALAMILADELEADWSKVQLGPVPENPAAWSRPMSTGGSRSVRSSWDTLRKAGATARAMLVAAAAETWGVEPATCRAENGTVVHVTSRRRLGYGVLARKAATLVTWT